MMKEFKNPVFIDSGAHGLYNEQLRRKGYKYGYAWYKTQEFWDYVDVYINFIKEYGDHLSAYPNVDVIFNPEMTWEVQEYIESKGIKNLIPVIHYGTDRKWLIKYLKKGYDYIALGGVGQEVNHTVYSSWADSMFDIICDTQDRTPVCKVHGFAMTAHSLLLRYPWYSVDSTTWLNFGIYGQLIIPPRIDGKWRYDIPYNLARLSDKGSAKLKHASPRVKRLAVDYITEKGYRLGKSEERDGKMVAVEPGLMNSSQQRCSLNAEYFLDLCLNTKPWPWPFTINKGLNL